VAAALALAPATTPAPTPLPHSPPPPHPLPPAHSVLGVSKSATTKEIKSAYRQKARKLHPDVNKEPGAEEQFKAVSNAYEILSDDSKRQIYDRFGEAGLKGGMGGMGGAGAGGPYSDPFDIFSQFFGGGMGGGGFGGGGFGGQPGGGRRRAVPGEDERADLQLDFLDAVFGVQREIAVSRLAECGKCAGSGSEPDTTPTTCGTCGGTGQVVQAAQTPLGVLRQVTACPDCGGAGQRSTPCSGCSGEGRVRERKTITLRVPAGVDSGSRLRVRGEGNAGRRGGEPGNLYVFINVKSDPDLRRDGVDIRSQTEVPFTDAILGTTVKVRTVDGEVDLKIPAGTQPNTTLLMSKRGVPKMGGAAGARGDHLVRVRVLIPESVTDEEADLVRKLAELEQAREPKAGGWFGKKKK